jgi:tryptophan-rich sensory protein
MHSEKMIRRILVLAAVVIFVLLFAALAASQKARLQTELEQPDISEPQLFCGYCHILTYPSLVQKGYELWKKGKHNKVGCVE